MDADARKLRNALRAHGRQLGDELDPKRGTQSIDRLTHEVAFEHWHRMLFARFLAENGLLMHPTAGAAVTLKECRELALDEGQDPWALAASFAQESLPQIFRKDDPALRIVLPANRRTALEHVVGGLPVDVFLAGDALGWVYQFWQADKKDEVNQAGNEIGADELPSVTQLFTEDYMVDFLLDNTLGAWWAGKALAANETLSTSALSESELRSAVSLPGCPWTYLRFVKSEAGQWSPAAGTFDGWPNTVADITCLDPSMGSGHFVVAMFERIVSMRMAAEGMSEADAVAAVLSHNLYGLELDARCAQIAAFNLALAAWLRVGHCALPSLNLACSGLAPHAQRQDWLSIAGSDSKLRTSMDLLYSMFESAPVLGSLINPRATHGGLLEASYHELQPLLAHALGGEAAGDFKREAVVTARGLAHAAAILAGEFALVATNVPYLTRQRQCRVLRDHCERLHSTAKADLATCFIERCMQFLLPNGALAVVAPSNWLFQPAYKKFRKSMLELNEWHSVVRLGAGAFDGVSGEVVNVTLTTIANRSPRQGETSAFSVDATEGACASEKARILEHSAIAAFDQLNQRHNPDSRVVLGDIDPRPLLSTAARSLTGLRTADNPQFVFCGWELPRWGAVWVAFQSTVSGTRMFGGREHVLRWDGGAGALSASARLGAASIQGRDAWSKRGVTVSLMGNLPATLYSGDMFDMNCGAVWPVAESDLAAVWCYCSSEEFSTEVRKIDQQLKLTTATLLKVPFDLNHWQAIGADRFPGGLPKPSSTDPTQWLFDGHPAGADQSLHVAVARLLGYQWPRQTGSGFLDCPATGPDGLEGLADDDGIVPINPMRGEPAASERLLALLRASFVAKGLTFDLGAVAGLLGDAGGKSTDLNDWLLNEFFEQHCKLFHNRPFVWHIWDGRKDGFNVLVNYHRLAAPGDAGRQLLEKLTYDYLKDWIDRQQDGVKANIAGAEARLAAAIELQKELIKIIAGEPPYDVFVRWKPLADQAIGWQPDINDGVRLNIRPFLKAQDVGKKGAGILRSKPNIKWDKDRGKEPERAKTDFPWFWSCDPETNAAQSTDFSGGREFTGERWNDLHYTVAAKNAARERRAKEKK
jgi:hypothetical protein